MSDRDPGRAPEPPPDATGPDLDRAMRRFLDGAGRLKVWPSRLKDQKLALAWLAARFDAGRRYHEREVNARLEALHAFGDWALLRRALVDYGFLARERDGSAYWREPTAE